MITDEKWELKLCSTILTDCSSGSKTKAFLDLQMLQHISTIISMKKGTCRIVLNVSRSWNGSMFRLLFRPSLCQHWTAKEHFKNRCSTASSIPDWQIAHPKSSRYIFLLLKTPLVLSLFCRRSQKKILCFNWQDFENPEPIENMMQISMAFQVLICLGTWKCWIELSPIWPLGQIGPWSRALIGGAQPFYGWWAPVALRYKEGTPRLDIQGSPPQPSPPTNLSLNPI